MQAARKQDPNQQHSNILSGRTSRFGSPINGSWRRTRSDRPLLSLGDTEFAVGDRAASVRRPAHRDDGGKSFVKAIAAPAIVITEKHSPRPGTSRLVAVNRLHQTDWRNGGGPAEKLHALAPRSRQRRTTSNLSRGISYVAMSACTLRHRLGPLSRKRPCGSPRRGANWRAKASLTAPSPTSTRRFRLI